MPVTPLPSASVVLVRPSGPGWETYLLRRNPDSRAFPGMWVFPGGTVRAEDVVSTVEDAGVKLPLQIAWTSSAAQKALSRELDAPPPPPDECLALFACALRELFEETGVLILKTVGGATLDGFIDTTLLSQVRREPLALTRALERHGLQTAPELLVYYAHWITPEALPQRFDTRFFLGVLPSGQVAEPDGEELVEGIWLTANDAIQQTKTGDLMPHFATLQHLKRLAPYSSLDAVLEFARTKAVIPVLPPTREQNGRHVPMIPPDIDGVW